MMLKEPKFRALAHNTTEFHKPQLTPFIHNEHGVEVLTYLSVHTYIQQKNLKKKKVILESIFSDSCISFTVSPVTCNITIIISGYISVQLVSLSIYAPLIYVNLDLKDSLN